MKSWTEKKKNLNKFSFYLHFLIYNIISVFPTINLALNIEMCNPSIIFVGNYCSSTMFMYPILLIL